MIKLILMKELKSFFQSPMAYILAGLFSLVVGWMFFNQLSYFTENIQKLPVSMRHEYDFANEVVIKLFGNINFLLLFITPILSMKFFSEEMKDKTIDLYFTSPISEFELILGKYLALLCQGLFLISTSYILPIFLGKISISDYSFVYSGYLGLFLNFASFSVLGLFASSLTKSQVLAVVIGFIFIMFAWLISMLSLTTNNYFLSEFYRYASVNFHFENFVKGSIGISDFVFYISFIMFIIYLLKVRLQSRLW